MLWWFHLNACFIVLSFFFSFSILLDFLDYFLSLFFKKKKKRQHCGLYLSITLMSPIHSVLNFKTPKHINLSVRIILSYLILLFQIVHASKKVIWQLSHHKLHSFSFFVVIQSLFGQNLYLLFVRLAMITPESFIDGM